MTSYFVKKNEIVTSCDTGVAVDNYVEIGDFSHFFIHNME